MTADKREQVEPAERHPRQGRPAMSMRQLTIPFAESGATHWRRVAKFNRDAATIADHHYSRRKIGSPQFMPPGQTVVLLGERNSALWGWWRPHPDSGLSAMNGLDGWTCSIFRNESGLRSSELILQAESILAETHDCGPSGMLTYVWDSKIKSSNPGFCFWMAGWIVVGRSADRRKTLLWKPFHLAGIAACAWPRVSPNDPERFGKRSKKR